MSITKKIKLKPYNSFFNGIGSIIDISGPENFNAYFKENKTATIEKSWKDVGNHLRGAQQILIKEK